MFNALKDHLKMAQNGSGQGASQSQKHNGNEEDPVLVLGEEQTSELDPDFFSPEKVKRLHGRRDQKVVEVTASEVIGGGLPGGGLGGEFGYVYVSLLFHCV